VLSLIDLLTQGTRSLREPFDGLAAILDRRDALRDFVGRPPGLVDGGRNGGERPAQSLRFLGMCGQSGEALLGGVHADVEVPSALVERGGDSAEVGETLVHVRDQLALRLDGRPGVAHSLDLLLHELDGRHQLLQVADSFPQVAHRLVDSRQPRPGLRLLIAEP
jgi:hypothetical protein